MGRVTTRSRRLVSGPALILLGLGLAAPARALDLSAPLMPLGVASGCVRDAASAGGSCAGTAAGLLGASALAVPGATGRRLAVASPDEDAVALLRRFPSGAIVGGRCLQPPGERPCGEHAVGLRGADALSATPDGALNVGARDDRAVIELRGTHQTGCVSAMPLAGCASRDLALGGVAALAGDPSGHFVYAVSFGETSGSDSVAALRRSDGGLVAVKGRGGCIQSVGSATARCAVRTAGLEGAVAAAASPDGHSLYVAARMGSAVVAFRRDRTTGALSPLGCVGDPRRSSGCAMKAEGLQGADAVAVSPDGATVYVAAADPGAVVALRRDRRSGALVGVIGCVSVLPQPGCGLAPALRGARALLVTPDGSELDVAADAADTIVTLGLTRGAGSITGVRDTAAVTGAVNAPAALVAAGPDVYAASPYDDGVVALTRTSH
ncbi:MAG: trimeric autotransporter adhesin [Baekduia sp.]|jgi:DNA-binding beta-propeller fold protein YncE|nr:trimeric autotransporter adhesin [Baekduia sp.]